MIDIVTVVILLLLLLPRGDVLSRGESPCAFNSLLVCLAPCVYYIMCVCVCGCVYAYMKLDTAHQVLVCVL